MQDPNSSNIVDPLEACLDAQEDKDIALDSFSDDFGDWVDNDPLVTTGDVLDSGFDAWGAIDTADTICDIADPISDVPETDIDVNLGLDF